MATEKAIPLTPTDEKQGSARSYQSAEGTANIYPLPPNWITTPQHKTLDFISEDARKQQLQYVG